MSDLAARTLERVPDRLRPGADLAVRTVADAFRDRVPGLAAEMAFFMVLSLAPLLITVFTGIAVADDVLGTQVIQTATARATQLAREFLAPDAADGFVDILATIQRQRAAAGVRSLLSFGFVATLLSASRAFRVTFVAISIAYDLEDTRPQWVQAALGLAMAVAGIVVGVVLIPLFVAGPRLGVWLAEPLGLGEAFASAWASAYWPVVAAVVTLLLIWLYHVAAPWYTPWLRDLPGAVLAMALALGGSAALQLYTARAIVGDENVFGFLAAPLALLLWLYVVSFSILLGAELNAEIEKKWPSTETKPR